MRRMALILLFSAFVTQAQETDKLKPPEGLPHVEICAERTKVIDALRKELEPRGFLVSIEDTTLTATREFSGWEVSRVTFGNDLYFERLPKEEVTFTFTPNKKCLELQADAILTWEHAFPLSKKGTKLLAKTKWWKAAIQHELEKLKKAVEEANGAPSPKEISVTEKSVDKFLFNHFKNSPNMIDQCALKLVHKIKFDTYRDWPALCNEFRDTYVVRDRVKELEKVLEALDLTEKQKNYLKEGRIWIGATKIMAELAWGKPKDVNRSTTSHGVNEQWVYDGGFLYFKNGKLTAIQN